MSVFQGCSLVKESKDSVHWWKDKRKTMEGKCEKEWKKEERNRFERKLSYLKRNAQSEFQYEFQHFSLLFSSTWSGLVPSFFFIQL
jgi:hypothetical protein